MRRIVVAIMIFVALGILLSGCAQKVEEKYVGPVEKVTLSLTEEPVNWLTLIAVEKDFFSQEGLDVTLKEYPSGKRALLDGLFAGEVDIAAAADVPIVFNSFERQDFKVIATIGTSDNVPRIIARKDRGIYRPSDLQGKHIATQEASAVHFFLSLFLLKYTLAEDSVKISFMNAEELPQALADGEIDAFSMREPFITQAKALLGDNAVIFAEPGLYLQTFNLVAYDSFIKDNPEIVKKILRALLRAEEYANNHPAAAVEIISSRTGVAEDEVFALWPELHLRVFLDQSLIVALEDIAKWAIRNDLTDKTEMPNYLDYIHVDALEEVKPGAVKIIR